MVTLLAFIFFGFGLIIGSFLNVVILRQGTGRTTSGRSGCFSCGHQLQWFDLVPVLSWLLLRGRCRYCGSRISPQYPLVELSTALLFGVLGSAPLVVGLVHQAVLCVLASLLIIIAVYDMRHTIIPDEWVYGFIGVSLLLAFITVTKETMPLSVVVAGPLTAVPLFLLWFFSQGRAMGFGDVKLSIGMGYLLGLWSGLSAVFLAFIIGGVLSTPLLFLSSGLWKKIRSYLTHRRGLNLPLFSVSMKSEVPFGPFLVLATFIVWISELYGTPFTWPFA